MPAAETCRMIRLPSDQSAVETPAGSPHRPLGASAAATAAAGFDFTLHMRRLCEDMVARLEQLRHIDMARVAVSFAQTRTAGSQRHVRLAHAAAVRRRADAHRPPRTPLGHAAGLRPDGREMLYILNFYLPRFLDLPLPREAHHGGPRAMAHRAAVRRRPAAVRRPLLRPRLVAEAVRRPRRGAWWTAGWRWARRSRSTASCGRTSASWSPGTAASTAAKSQPQARAAGLSGRTEIVGAMRRRFARRATVAHSTADSPVGVLPLLQRQDVDDPVCLVDAVEDAEPSDPIPPSLRLVSLQPLDVGAEMRPGRSCG